MTSSTQYDIIMLWRHHPHKQRFHSIPNYLAASSVFYFFFLSCISVVSLRSFYRPPVALPPSSFYRPPAETVTKEFWGFPYFSVLIPFYYIYSIHIITITVLDYYFLHLYFYIITSSLRHSSSFITNVQSHSSTYISFFSISQLCIS